MAVGYSGTPLVRKLGIKEGCRLHAINAPTDYPALLVPMPDGVQFDTSASVETDIVHLFTGQRAELAKSLQSWRKLLRPDAAIWISWPKKSSKVRTDITEDTIRELAYPLGFVDLKVCAVTDVWSGLKLVLRKELR